MRPCCCNPATHQGSFAAHQPRSSMARVMREELCTMIRVRGNIGVLVALAGLLVACAGGSSQWQRERLTALPKAGERLLGERLIAAQYVVVGRSEAGDRAI